MADAAVRLSQVGRLLEGERTRALADVRPLELFLHGRREEAFTELVRRHGPLVLGVCRRVLGDAHDAQDAFQATFLVLARRVVTSRRRDALPSWLHGVAHRLALKWQVPPGPRRPRHPLTELHRRV